MRNCQEAIMERGEISDHPRSALARLEEGIRYWLRARLHLEPAGSRGESARLLRPGSPPSAPRQRSWPIGTCPFVGEDRH